MFIVGFSLVYLKKACKRCLELGITKEEIKKVIKQIAAEQLEESEYLRKALSLLKK